MAMYGHLPPLPRRRSLKSRAMCASKPMPAMLKNARSLRRPTSIAVVSTDRIRAIACSGSRGRPERGGEAVARPCRDESKRGRAVDERGPDLVEGAVTTPDDHQISARVHGRGGELSGVAGSLGQMNGWVQPACRSRSASSAPRRPAAAESSPAPETGLMIAEICTRTCSNRASIVALPSPAPML